MSKQGTFSHVGSGRGKLREPAERTLPCFLWAHIPSGLLMVLLFVCGFALSLQTGLIVLRRGISGCRSKIVWPSLQAPSLGDDSSVTPSAPRTRGVFPGAHTRSCELTAHRQLSLRPVHFCCASAGKEEALLAGDLFVHIFIPQILITTCQAMWLNEHGLTVINYNSGLSG